MDRQDIRTLGQELKKKKTWRNGLLVGGQSAELIGNGLVVGAPLTGPELAPEVALLGAGLIGGGKLYQKIGKSDLLKSHRQKK